MRAKMNSCYSSIIHFDAPSSFLLPSTPFVSPLLLSRWVTLRWSPYISGRLIFGWKNIKMTNVEASARLWFSAPELEDKSLLKEIQTFVLIIVQRALTLQFKVSECVGIKSEDINKWSHQFRVLWDKLKHVQQQNEPLRILTEAVRGPISSLLICHLFVVPSLFMKATNCL